MTTLSGDDDHPGEKTKWRPSCESDSRCCRSAARALARAARRGERGDRARPHDRGQPVHRDPELRQHVPGRGDAVRHGAGQPRQRRPGRLRLQPRHIYGFSQTHLSGRRLRRRSARCRIMPTTGAVTSGDPTTTGSHLQPRRPSRRTPGYYQVGLDPLRHRRRADRHRRAPAGSATRSRRTDQANVLFNTGRANMRRARPRTSRSPATARSRAAVDDGGFCAGHDRAPAVLQRAVRPPVRALRHVARLDADPGRARERQRLRRQRRAGSPSTPRTTEQVDLQGRHLLHGPRRRARATSPPRRGDGLRLRRHPRAGAPQRWHVDAVQGDDRRAARPTAASPTTRRSTTRSCTRTWSATSTAPTRASTAQVHTAQRLHADGRTSRCGTPTGRRTSCSSCSQPRSPATSRCRCSRSGARAAGCRAGRSSTPRRTS